MGRSLRVEADGGSRGNPGVAGYGALVRDRDTGQLLVELAAPLGTASNNVAEYRGMLAGLRAARTIDPAADVEVAMDSKLVVEQMAGRWRIKHADMRALALEGRDLVAEITGAGGAVDFTWIPRGDNAAADALSNRGMDGEDVEDWHVADQSGDAGEPEEEPHPPARGRPTRVVLVRRASRVEAERAAGQVAALVGDATVRVVSAGPSVGSVGIIAARLGVEPEVDTEWDEGSPGAWERAVASGGTTVVVCDRAPVLVVLGRVLGLPPGRSERLAIAPGSLTLVEARPDGEAVVAFTNRT